LAAVELDGPPRDGRWLAPHDDLYSFSIPGTDVTITCRVNEYELVLALQSIE
jgi:hypothetical protein